MIDDDRQLASRFRTALEAAHDALASDDLENCLQYAEEAYASFQLRERLVRLSSEYPRAQAEADLTELEDAIAEYLPRPSVDIVDRMAWWKEALRSRRAAIMLEPDSSSVVLLNARAAASDVSDVSIGPFDPKEVPVEGATEWKLIVEVEAEEDGWLARVERKGPDQPAPVIDLFLTTAGETIAIEIDERVVYARIDEVSSPIRAEARIQGEDR